MEPYRVAPITNMQMLEIVKFRFLNSRRSSNGLRMRKAWRTNPTMSARPSTKLTRTGVLVNRPVMPTSYSEYTSAAKPGERRAKPTPSKLFRILSSWPTRNLLERMSVKMPMGTLM